MTAAEAALTIARLGGRAALCARVGADIHGRRLLHLYEDSGVDVRGVKPDRRAPTGFRITVRELKVSAGAGFLVAKTGDIMTMPGLPKVPAAERIDVDENGRISGLF